VTPEKLRGYRNPDRIRAWRIGGRTHHLKAPTEQRVFSLNPRPSILFEIFQGVPRFLSS
jgi:hypothetical protein